MDSKKFKSSVDYYERYNRQHYVLGEKAMSEIQRSRVLVSGLGGVGIEIVKNIALAGVHELTIHDTVPCTWQDLCTQCYLNESSLNVNRAVASFTHVASLNPYVKYILETEWNLAGESLEFLDKFSCVVVTDQPLEVQVKVCNYCHARNICFIAADSYGAFSYIFNDAGPTHEFFDANGEPCKRVFIDKIHIGTETVIDCLCDREHDFEVGDCVKVISVNEGSELNYSDCLMNTYRVIGVELPRRIIISADTSSCKSHLSGGVLLEVKQSSFINFRPLEQCIKTPEFCCADYEFESSASQHIAHLALHEFRSLKGHLPRPWNIQDANEMLYAAQKINSNSLRINLNELLVKKLAWSARGKIVGLTAFVGGVAAQETIKVISKKFVPLKQFLYFHVAEVLENAELEHFDQSQYCVERESDSRYHGQILLLGNRLNAQIMNLKVFLIGAGAIGCELLKNMALMGVSAGDFGKITVTDNDFIEKSNLNRQLLFRDKDIKKSKSTTAAKAAKAINSELLIEAFLDRVEPASKEIYSDLFFQTLDVVLNALDNVEARLYVDSRCVNNCRPLIESGTLGTKGHVQVILPHLTESYSSQADPEEEVYPLCTIKSFPTLIEHSIEWARSKFESNFCKKPQQLLQFLSDQNTFLKSGDDCPVAADKLKIIKYFLKILTNPIDTFDKCVVNARLKFHSYFFLSVETLLKTFPPNTKLGDGTLFWKPPKVMPDLLNFDLNNSHIYSFIVSTALLLSEVYGVVVPEGATEFDNICKILDSVSFEKLPMKNHLQHDTPSSECEHAIVKLEKILQSKNHNLKLKPIEFAKDDDYNNHIEFISSCSNLRALNYHIAPVDKLECKRIAGKIIPAIATTTAAVAALASLELIKITKKLPLDNFKNYYLNLALPYFQSSEPASAKKNYLPNGSCYTLWDKWVVSEGDITVEQFKNFFAEKYKINVAAIIHNTYTVYMSRILSHKIRLKKKISSLLQLDKEIENCVDLVISCEDFNSNVVDCPNVRFYWR